MTRYVNLDGTVPDKGLRDLLKWQVVDRLAVNRRRDPVGFFTPRRDNDGAGLSELTAAERLRPMNIVTVSHSHYDHMDVPSLRTLAASGHQASAGEALDARRRRNSRTAR